MSAALSGVTLKLMGVGHVFQIPVCSKSPCVPNPRVPRYALEILENRSSQDGKRKDKYLPDLPRAGEYDEDESRIHDESEELLLPAPPSRPTSWYRTASVQSTLDSTIRWVQGPHPPRPYTIERSFPQFQTTPIRLLDKYLRKQSHRMWSFGVLYLIWFIMFFFILRT